MSDSNSSSSTDSSDTESSKLATTEDLKLGAESDQSDGNEPEASSQESEMFYLTVKIPHEPHKVNILVSRNEEVQDIRQAILECAETLQYSCFHLEHNQKRINDFVELNTIDGIDTAPELKLVEDPYTEREARIHFLRVKDFLGLTTEQSDVARGIGSGSSLFQDVLNLTSSSESKRNEANSSPEAENSKPELTDNLYSKISLSQLCPKDRGIAPKVLKSISLSHWHPPPAHLRQKGHYLYLQAFTNEGEQFHITSHVSGFFVNRSSNSRFDPFPRAAPKNAAAHSLLTLITMITPSFGESFDALRAFQTQDDLIAALPIMNALPASPWVVRSPVPSEHNHLPDIGRSQEKTLQYGIDNTENLRDWNEEFQSTKELPKGSVSERCLRDRLMQKLCAEYNDAAVKGAVLVAKGDITPLNPTEIQDAQIYLYNNIFFSFGCDGLGTFSSQGGNEAARVATGKDVFGVRSVNMLDLSNLYAPATVVVDYMGRRIVAQSIVPGIFKQKEPGETQIDYGGIEGRETVADDPAFAILFEKLAKAMRTKKHAVYDKAGKMHMLETSSETKGLLGTDGRKYVLDLYRTTPLDIAWIEKYWVDETGADNSENIAKRYPHRMSVLRHELVEAFWNKKKNTYILQELNKRINEAKAKGEDDKADNGEASKSDVKSSSDMTAKESSELAEKIEWDIAQFSLNPDVLSGVVPADSPERETMDKDEVDVHEACTFLLDEVIPGLVSRIDRGELNVPMEGQYLSWLLQKQGINLRYLGKVASLCNDDQPRLVALKALAEQEMIARGFKHVLNSQLRTIPTYHAASCISHLLNCLLGTKFNTSPQPSVDESFRLTFTEEPFGFESIDPQMLQTAIEDQIESRYQYSLPSDWASHIRLLPMLREIAGKTGLQLAAKEYIFDSPVFTDAIPASDGPSSNPSKSGGSSSKKKKKASQGYAQGDNIEPSRTTFVPDDILNILPIVKDSTPKSLFAAEVLEAARTSIGQNDKEVSLELVLESLSLHENIYGALHPETARLYTELSMIYYHLDDKSTARELGRKAVVVSERLLGLDSAETIHSYLNLGLFESANGNTHEASICLKHGLDLWRLVYGPDHPDLILPLTNIGAMSLGLKAYSEAAKWYEAALTLSESTKSGPANNAAILFQLAHVLGLNKDFKGAVNRMREAYSLYLNAHGPDHKNTKEAETWLEQLTQNAVSIAKHAKSIQDRGLRRVRFAQPVSDSGKLGLTAASEFNGKAKGSEMKLNGVQPVDSRSIDDLLKYIEGDQQKTKKRRPGKNSARTIPKTISRKASS
jgi:protein TIF31